jgi:hypothetical protein
MGVETIVWPAYEAGVLPLDDPAIENWSATSVLPRLVQFGRLVHYFCASGARRLGPSVELASTSPVYETDASLSTLTRRDFGDRSGTRTR